MSNEFKGKTLEGAIARATAAYRNSRRVVERKQGESCADLVLEITGLQREIGRLSDEASRLEDDAEDLRRQAGKETAFAVLSALGGLAGSARGIAVAARIISSRSVRNLTRGDIFGLLSLFGPGVAALQLLSAFKDVIDADRLIDRAEDLLSDGERLGDELLDAVDEFDRSGCGSDRHLQS